MPRLNDLPDFLVKLWNIVHDPAASDVISWNDDGTAFVITSPKALQERVLTRYFVHAHYTSFIRQLHFYGFKKQHLAVMLSYHHPCFRRNRFYDLSLIQRRPSPKPQEKLLKHDVTKLKSEADSMQRRLSQLDSQFQSMTQEQNSHSDRIHATEERMDRAESVCSALMQNF